MKLLNNTILFTFCLFISINSFAQNAKVEKLHQRLNTDKYDETTPCISSDGHTLYFTRGKSPEFEKSCMVGEQDISKSLSGKKYQTYLRKVYGQLAGTPIQVPEKSNLNQDVWIAQTANKDFDIILHPGTPLNNALPNSIRTILPTTNEIVVFNQSIQNGKKLNQFSKSSRNADGSWTKATALNIPFLESINKDAGITFSEDGKVMIIALEQADAIGKSDLYICEKQKNGYWSKPKNMGRGINTLFAESTPHLAPDQKSLYFSSDRGNEKGKTDLYFQKRLGTGWDQWSAPQKFRHPINTNANESHPYFCESTGFLYFSSNREGSWDIFRTKISQAKPNGLTIQGQLFNDFDLSPIDALISSRDKNGNKVVTSTRNGKFCLLLPWNAKVKISARKKDFKEDYTVIVTGPKVSTSFVKNIKLFLEPMKEEIAQKVSPSSVVSKNPIDIDPKVGSKLQLDHIYFQRSTAKVYSKSYPEMDRLANYLLQHPEVIILISGHTDNQGDKQLLKKLSEERAEAIKNYLINNQQINPQRIKTIGYGAEKSLNDNSTDKLRKINRRVEVEIIGTAESTSLRE